ncbi:MAG TPA: DNA alkylation repair protein [Planctomycetota bacterium]|nr:DNA alkylation repair protein [Planctomycetota bacterium]
MTGTRKAPSKSAPKRSPDKAVATRSQAELEREVASTLTALKQISSKTGRDAMARYAIPSHNAFGVSMAAMQRLARKLGKDHELALGLWKTGNYEARTVAALVDDPKLVTPAQMDRWCKDFDSWAICDTICFKLFDKTPHAYDKVEEWADLDGEFQKRAAFALLASLALHDKQADDKAFLPTLARIEDAASDERNFVKKGVSWALRGVGRRSPVLHAASVKLSRKLAASTDAVERWIGKDALKDLTKPAVTKRIETRRAARS